MTPHINDIIYSKKQMLFDKLVIYDIFYGFIWDVIKINFDFVFCI